MAVYVLCVIPPTVVYLTVPSWHITTWALIGLFSVAAILVGVHRNRPTHRWPWLLLAAANLTFTAGDTAYNILESAFDEPNPFPSLADVFYLSTYPLFAAGIFGIIHFRCPARDRAGLLDALILTSGLALLSWVHLINPVAQAEGLTWLERAISVAYPLGDVLILAMLVRLLTLGGIRERSVQLMTVGTIGILVSDVLYGVLQLQGTWQVGTPMDLGWVVFFTAWGLAALHPSMVRLTEPLPEPRPGIAMWRLVALAGASLVAPAMLLAQSLRGHAHDVAVTAVFAGAMFLLVLARLWGLVDEHRKAVARERSLRLAAVSLVAAVSPEEVAHAVRTAAATLFRPETAHEAVLLVFDTSRSSLQPIAAPGCPGEWRLDGGPHGESPYELLSRGTHLTDAGDLGPDAAAALPPSSAALLCPLGLEASSAPEPLIGALLLAGPVKRLQEMSGPAESLAAQAALALARVGLNEEINRRKSEEYFRTLVHNTSDVILIVDDDNTVRYASPSAYDMFGCDLRGGIPLARLVAEGDHERALRTLGRARGGDGLDLRDDWQVVRGEDGCLDVEVRCRNLRHEQTVHGVVLTLRDVTEQRQLERELVHRAFHDSLTGLPNRVLLLERLERALLRGRRDAALTCVLFVDLDDFKVVNDMMGHSVGDELLVAVARRLTAALRLSDTAARLGGDEFAILMEGAREPADAEALAAEIVRALARPFGLVTGSTSVSACVGVATARPGDEAEDLLGHADLALYAAKTAGKRQWQRYRPDLHSGMAERHELRAGLDNAITQEAFALRYQPIVEIVTGAVVGFEALIRWPHSRRGLVPPDQFINLAEETGHIMPLGAWVLERAASDVARWQRLRPRPEPLHLNVNVSARQFRDTGFVDQVRQVLARSGLAPGSLVLELTESVLVRRDEQIRTAMRTLKDLGVSLAIDDFGTGFSSLSYMREFPIDVLKVDKSFIDDIITDGQQVALVEGIVRIADVLGLQVTAEGIENDGQRDLLGAMGCRYGQGYLFARPMTAAEAQRFLLVSQERQLSVGRSGHSPDTPRESRRRSQPETVARRTQHWDELARLRRSSRMCDAVIDEVRGRRVRSGDHWLADFASCNYLGFDLEPEIMDAIAPHVRRWGTHPSWSRMIGNPRLYPQIEARLAELLGAPDVLLLPTITLIHASVIPVLAAGRSGGGHVFVEARAHRTMYDGCMVAHEQGATVRRFHAKHPDELTRLLRAAPLSAPRLVCLDGVNSMTGNLPDLPDLLRVCRAEGALLYVDDAHGFGVIGERGATETSPYGMRGNCVVRHFGESYDDVVLVGGFSKAYSSLLAFVTAPPALKAHLKVAAGPYLYSGPSPTASLATALAGLDVNERRGDAIRADLHRKTSRVLDHVRGLGLATPNTDGLPIIEIPIADSADLTAVGEYLWDHGIYVTLAAYPLVPREEVGFRIQVTARNTDDEIDRLNAVLTGVAEQFPVRRTATAEGSPWP
ncbi:aminotransferase class I/II-fold pyridoxal phosphate-dependent enzyme [Streptomyces sp. HC44]|uniref:Aminotransferase class I/II-fold pyridoxal phosphate-dependent enzyme n=1 Tax=Streptomyces scabichelini TaxID=2711217 RepID=A0A6G4V4Z7_9ACTN|nr:aminotransferase class I/II-fold pyridoxal phosphate-dependent enzyme [Streptomyces scabichelini]NGO09051.1 aminotransferase class I/II-fold pyridoxal phosphate-dependent enzyme [Streptomyces scabichelini]